MTAPNAQPARFALFVAAIAAWYAGTYHLSPLAQRMAGSDALTGAAETLVGHWLTWQLPTVLLCAVVWLVGEHRGLLPPLRSALGAGLGVRAVVVSGALGGVALTLATLALGVAGGGTFGWHPPYVKMLGDLGSNLYEEIVFRGLLFCAIYGAATNATFPLAGPVDGRGVRIATLGATFVFAAGHGQYPLPVRVVLGAVALVFCWPFVRARSLWAPWITHMIGDIVADSIIAL